LESKQEEEQVFEQFLKFRSGVTAVEDVNEMFIGKQNI
jgi:hypothetical protein